MADGAAYNLVDHTPTLHGQEHGNGYSGHGNSTSKASVKGKDGKIEPRVFKAEEFKHNVDIRSESKRPFGRGVERTVKISHETEKLYRDSLILHIKDLSRVDDGLLEELGFTTDLDLKRQFLDGRGNVNEDAVAGIFNDAKGFALATMVIEQQLAIGSLVVGWGTDRTMGKRNPRQEKWAFDLLANDPKLAEYVKKTTNIDVADFEWSRLMGKVEKRSVDAKNPRSHIRTSPNTKSLANRLKSMENARYKFLHDDLKIPKKLAKRPAEYSLRTLKMNQMNLVWESEVTSELENIGIEWKKGRLNLGTQLDHPENWRNLLQARESVMAKTLQDAIERTSTKNDVQDTRYGKLKALDSVVGSRSTADMSQRQERAQERIERAEKDRDSADAAKESLDNVKKRRQAVVFAKGKAREDLGISIGTDEVTYIEKDIEAEKKKIHDRTDMTSYDSRRIQADKDRDIRLTNRFSDPRFIPGLTDEQRNQLSSDIRNEILAEHKRRIDEINEDQKNSGVDAKIAELEGYLGSIKEAEAALVETDFLKATNETSMSLEKSFDDLKGISVTDSSGALQEIEVDELRILTVDQILRKVNEIRKISTESGSTLHPNAYLSWPEGENDAHREQVVLAIAEARASSAPPSGAGNPPGEYTQYKNWGLTEAQIVTYSRDQVNEFMNDLNLRSGGTEGWPSGDNAAKEPEVDAVLAFGINKLSKRIEKLGEISKVASGELPRLQYEHDNISTSEDEQKRLDMAMKLVERKSEIYPRALNVRQEIDKLTDSADASTTTEPNVTDAEKAPGVKMWELAWMELLSGYQEKTSEREASFSDAKRFYEPEDVVKKMAAWLDIDDTKPVSLILLELRERVTGIEPGTTNKSKLPKISGREFRRALQGYINEYADDTERALS